MFDTATVLALAPDPDSAKAGQGLASARHWTQLGKDQDSLWGLCQGSGKDPYQARVALVDLASSCSCPSRKLPCKHVIGLLLLEVQGSLPTTDAPAFVSEWLAKRLERFEKKQQKAEVEHSPEQAAKAAAAADRRAESRLDRRAEGLADLQRWMADLLRSGLGQAPVTDADFWKSRARRLVDAQLPGLARRLQRCYEHTIRRSDWPQAVLREFGLLTLAIEGAARISSMDAGQRADLERALGVAQGQDQIDTQAALEDDWLCLGVRVEPLDAVTMQRSWWWGESSQRLALLLNFTLNSLPLQSVGVPGRSERLRLAWYPASAPLRAQLLTRGGSQHTVSPPATDIEAALGCYAQALGADPWLESYALMVRGRLQLDTRQQLFLVDAGQRALPIGPIDAAGWRWLAISRGADYRFTGEWNGEHFALFHGWPA